MYSDFFYLILLGIWTFLISLQLDIAYDKFIRTTDPKHEAIVKEFYSRVLANGDIYRADYEGLYCINCEEYKVPIMSFKLIPIEIFLGLDGFLLLLEQVDMISHWAKTLLLLLSLRYILLTFLRSYFLKNRFIMDT